MFIFEISIVFGAVWTTSSVGPKKTCKFEIPSTQQNNAVQKSNYVYFCVLFQPIQCTGKIASQTKTLPLHSELSLSYPSLLKGPVPGELDTPNSKLSILN